MAEENHPEIVIVRRHARHAEEHHGGAWKIAFADFMTAMMALFLVLWLISSTSEKERRAVAQYFNPVKLVDMTTLKKGFHEPKETEMGSGPASQPTSSERSTHESEQRGVEPASEPAKAERAASRAGAKPPPDPDASRREAPQRKRPQEADPAAQAPRPTARPLQPAPAALVSAFADPFATIPGEPMAAAVPEAADGRDEVSAEPAAPPSETTGTMQRRRLAQRAGAAAPPARGAEPEDTEVVALASELMAGADADPGKQSAPKLEVRSTDEGVLISLTDAIDSMMFASGSAEPRRETIEMMQRIARSLATRQGGIVVRGHTDSRPYRSGTSDNWRLSTARAHAARDVLVRGGLAETRIERVEGYADRNPKVPADPAAPENRRIEILLRKGSE